MIPARFAGDRMKRFVEGMDRGQSTLFPECLEDWICEDNPVRVIDAFVEELDLAELKSCGVNPEATGRPSFIEGLERCIDRLANRLTDRRNEQSRSHRVAHHGGARRIILSGSANTTAHFRAGARTEGTLASRSLLLRAPGDRAIAANCSARFGTRSQDAWRSISSSTSLHHASPGTLGWRSSASFCSVERNGCGAFHAATRTEVCIISCSSPVASWFISRSKAGRSSAPKMTIESQFDGCSSSIANASDRLAGWTLRDKIFMFQCLFFCSSGLLFSTYG
jgi:hypothetical protein